jgi:hypothetical protein
LLCPADWAWGLQRWTSHQDSCLRHQSQQEWESWQLVCLGAVLPLAQSVNSNWSCLSLRNHLRMRLRIAVELGRGWLP